MNLRNLGLFQCQRTGLVKNNGVYRTQLLQRMGIFDQNPASGRQIEIIEHRQRTG